MQLITIKEAAEILNRGQSTVYQYINRGQLSKYKQLNKTLLDKAEVEALLEPKKVTS